MPTYTVNGLDSNMVRGLIAELKKERAGIKRKTNTICERLATMAAVRASLEFARSPYNGTNDVRVMVSPIKGGWRVRASGNAVLFIEYGAGARYGYGHPEPLDYGPGTYPSTTGNWDNPKGWWYAHGKHTYGNPPAAAMYHAEQDVKREIRNVANEVFNE